MKSMYADVKRVLIDKATLSKRVAELGAEITRDYEGKRPIVVGILKGAVVFYADLIRAIDLPIRMDFMAVSSYGNGTASSGKISIKKDIDVNVDGEDIIIVEDIIDTGNTLFNLKNLLLERQASSVKICTLLDKPSRRVADIKGDYVGFEVGNEFIIGYGLDYAEKYRNIGEICVIKEEAIV